MLADREPKPTPPTFVRRIPEATSAQVVAPPTVPPIQPPATMSPPRSQHRAARSGWRVGRILAKAISVLRASTSASNPWRGSGELDLDRKVVEQIARDLNVPEETQSELMDSGTPRFPNQVAWARFYLTREGLLDKSRRGVWRLTDRVTERAARGTDESAAQGHREELLRLLLDLPPLGFERLCQRLLRESGFVRVAVTGRSGDGGIDGHGNLEVNPLVSFKVLFQCKRYAKTVVPSQVRDFRGAMQGRADKGIILTTGTFTAEARREALRDGVRPSNSSMETSSSTCSNSSSWA